MRLNDETIYRDLRFSLGRHPQTGQPCLLFPVECGFLGYMACLQISEETFEEYRRDPYSALPFIERQQGRSPQELRELGFEV
ncbi:hypothetical protein V3W47_00160 [Deinococcus sp. YIM 134068]|uniref:hypothetical protein n=1 Tax=Deinococcus lichenicola TaxID=3118910 RepID=UPI002F936029